MSYNKEQFQAYVETAGKISILTAFAGVLIFAFVFLLNLGAKEFKQATAQGIATTTITVLNTPPAFANGPFESPISSSATPTNSGEVQSWTALGVDPSGEDYFLLICDGETASPTAVNGAPPVCGAGDVQLAISGTTTSNSPATAATTTTETFLGGLEEIEWFAWVCDAVPNARCNALAQQGTGTSSSPFNINHRPTFTGYWDDSPADPGATVVFYATSTDSDTNGTQDTVSLYVCSTPSFNSTSSLGCNGTELASTSIPVATNATATYAVPVVIQDDDYAAYGFIVDNHGHEASGGSQGTDSVLTINNVAPTIAGAQIILNGGADMTIVEGTETSGFTLEFQVADANSCDAVGGNTYDEIASYELAVYRSGVTQSGCSATSSADYDANNCYTSAAPTALWNLVCTASTTSCTYSVDGTDTTLQYDCTFPLWYIADPTDINAFYFDESWLASVIGIDDDGATSTYTESTNTNIEVTSVTAINLLDTTIPYPALEPGNDTGTLSASTTAESTGNTGLDHSLTGESMCNTYSTGNECLSLATSTIPEDQQQFATSAVAYGSGIALSSTTPQTLEIQINKSTNTTTPAFGDTYWGIAVPGAITFAGSYTGENTFIAVTSATTTW